MTVKAGMEVWGWPPYEQEPVMVYLIDVFFF